MITGEMVRRKIAEAQIHRMTIRRKV